MSDSPRPARVDHRVFEKAYEERQQIRDRFPMLPSGIVGNELYAQHCSILGGEPDFEEMWSLVDEATFRIREDGSFRLEDVKAQTYYSVQRVLSYLWFAEMCCLIRCVGKGRYRTLFDEANEADGHEYCWPDNLMRHAQDVLDDMQENMGMDNESVAADLNRTEADDKNAGEGPAPMFVVRDDVI